MSKVALLTPERIAALPAEQRAGWQQYVDRSAAQARLDQEALDAELRAHGLTKPINAPAAKDFKIDPKAAPEWYGGAEAGRIADAIVSFQTPSGGWSKAVSFEAGPRQPGVRSEGWDGVATFDNRATTEEMLFLAKVYEKQKVQKYADAFGKGLDYIFAAQMPNGGWPQVYPLMGGYHDEITFNDDMTTHVLEILRDVVSGAPDYAFVDEARRGRAREALAAGVACIVKAQVVEKGQLTVWGAQNDPISLAPAGARRFEPPSLTAGESLGLVRFLMGIEHPSPDVVRAVQGAVRWYRDSKITGIEVVNKPDPAGPKGFDRVVVPSPVAAPLWARFYELGTNRPIFVGRDAVVKYNLADIELERRVGYAWYSGKAEDLLETDYPKWRAKWAQQ